MHGLASSERSGMTRVTAEQAAAVIERDRRIVADWLRDRGHHPAFEGIVCPAVIIDPNEFGKCWGRWRCEHVKSEPRMGRRGDMLMALCAGHTEDGMKAGVVWCTANREGCREYLRWVAT